MDNKILSIINIVLGIILLIGFFSTDISAHEGIQTNLFWMWFWGFVGIWAISDGYYQYTTGKIPII